MMGALILLFLLIVPILIVIGSLRINIALISRSMKWTGESILGMKANFFALLNVFILVIYTIAVVYQYDHRVVMSDWDMPDLDQLGSFFQWMLIEMAHAGLILLVLHPHRQKDSEENQNANK